MIGWRAGFLVLIPALLLPTVASAQEEKPDCTNPMTQTDMNICAHQDYEKADAELNAAYPKAREAMRRMDRNFPESERGAEQALLTAQRAWIAFRDAECNAMAYGNRGGSMQPMVISTCLEELTRARINQLNELASEQ